jgi:hypothetical protein
MQFWRTDFAYFAIAGILAAASGCRESRVPDRESVVPVRGSVFVAGKPAAGAVVSFLPLGDSSPRALRSNGRAGNDGSFSLTTYVTADGAPVGEYVVTVYWADPAKTPPEEEEGEETDLAPDLLNGRFAAKDTSVLRATVGDKPIEFAPLDLGSSEVATSREYHLREK